MSGNSSIEWCDRTWNPVTGCDRTSPGCDNCYALTLAKRLKAMGSAAYQNDGDPRTSGPGFGLTLHPERLTEPRRWGKPSMVFVNSMSDLFHPDVPNDFVADVWVNMALASDHTFQILTKRPQHMHRLTENEAFWRVLLDQAAARGGGGGLQSFDGIYGATLPLPNVWLGTSIENDRYTFRAGYLRATPAAVRFLSLEPLLGPLPSLSFEGIDWVIVGAESGKGARPMDLGWVRDLRDRAKAAGAAFFFKQDAVNGRKVKLPELDGRVWNEFPGRSE